MKALLIIDMQLGSFRPYSIRYDTLPTIERINLLSKSFRDRGHLVIFIQHDGTRENTFLPHSEDWAILPELNKEPGDITIAKTANDAFYESDLQSVMDQHGISDLYFTGCATDFCMDSTIRSAMSRNYKVHVVTDGHTTADRPGINAKTVIEYFNWLWSDMIPTRFGVSVSTTGQILDSLEPEPILPGRS